MRQKLTPKQVVRLGEADDSDELGRELMPKEADQIAEVFSRTLCLAETIRTRATADRQATRPRATAARHATRRVTSSGTTTSLIPSPNTKPIAKEARAARAAAAELSDTADATTRPRPISKPDPSLRTEASQHHDATTRPNASGAPQRNPAP